MKAAVRRHIGDLHDRHNKEQKEQMALRMQLGMGGSVKQLHASKALVDEVIEEIQSRAIMPQNLEPPCWVSQGVRQNIISVHNGLLDLDADPPRLRLHNPDFFITVSLPYAYQPEAKCPKWEQFLQETFVDDEDREEKIGFLQRWFGLCLISDTTYQAFLVLYGQPGTGKSVIGGGLIAMLGHANVSYATPRAMNSRFGLDPLIGKLANVVTDLDSEEKLDRGIFKRLVDGGLVMTEQKYKNPRPACSTVRFVFGTNKMPTGSNVNDGMWRRMIVLECNQVVPPDRRNLAMSRPEYWLEQGELPGMLNWALAGLGKLRQEVALVPPARSMEKVEEQRRLADPTHDFIESYLAAAPDAEVERDALYRDYTGWMTGTHNKKEIRSKQVFNAAVRERFPSVTEVQSKIENRRPRCWKGLRRIGS
jgi:P4 family phage/plasmid primase-like protien